MQLALSDAEGLRQRKTTSRALFLDKIDEVIPGSGCWRWSSPITR